MGAAALCTTRFRAPPDLAAFCEAVLLALMQTLRTVDRGRCVRYLVDYLREVAEAEHQALGWKHPVQERDVHACQFPGCRCRVTESHHLEPISQGGSDELWNKVSLCAMHHRIARHLGMAKIWGRAPDDVYFQIGRRIWKDDRIIAVLE